MALVVCLSLLFWGLLESDERWGGPVIWTLSATHGVHLGDLPVAAVWLVGMVMCWRIAFSARGRS